MVWTTSGWIPRMSPAATTTLRLPVGAVGSARMNSAEPERTARMAGMGYEWGVVVDPRMSCRLGPDSIPPGVRVAVSGLGTRFLLLHTVAINPSISSTSPDSSHPAFPMFIDTHTHTHTHTRQVLHCAVCAAVCAACAVCTVHGDCGLFVHCVEVVKQWQWQWQSEVLGSGHG